MAASLLTLVACREGVEVVVTQDASGTTFATRPADSDFDACIDRAYVHAQGAEPRQVWYATRGAAHEPCLRAVRYAFNPEGFSAKPPPQLAKGVGYRVELIGKGFTAAADFTAK